MAFRVLLGAVLAFAAVRFVASGWIEALYLAPTYHFPWVEAARVPPGPVLYALFAVMAGAAVLVAAGRAYRAACAAFLAAFVYVELLDKTLYLNHYVLVTILAATLLAAPLGRADLARSGFTAPGWALDLLRLEVGLVYAWAGVCKLDPDWLLRAEPLGTWLRAEVDLPLVGPWLAWPPTAFAMAWAGAAFDLSIPLLLPVPRLRRPAYAVLIGFHVVLWLLFPIGVFPWIMLASATVFFSPGWPRRLVALPPAAPRPARPLPRPAVAAWLAVAAVLALVPARHLAAGGRVEWHEVGFRFAWRVMLIEKTGYVEYRVVERATGRTWRVSPGDELTAAQHEQMRTQPDLVAQYARHVHDRFAADGIDVAVYADSWASLNGRPRQRLVRPEVDLSRPLGGWRTWITPLER